MVRTLFAVAAHYAPSIIFIDEVSDVTHSGAVYIQEQCIYRNPSINSSDEVIVQHSEFHSTLARVLIASARTADVQGGGGDCSSFWDCSM
jgi:ABC-type polysaccharide/polyol phosphate transport system ATPase subunit